MPRKLQVLFVDDEETLLRAFRSLFRRDRDVWDTHFAPSGAAALALLESTPIDVVVSDMRMPEMNGAELLEQIRKRWPGTARLILSGHSGSEELLAGFSAMHGFLAKPCETATLRAAITRCQGVQEAAQTLAVREALGRLDRLPSPPTVYLELTRLANDRRSTIDDVSSLIAQDPSFALRVMQVANSAAFVNRPSASLTQCIRNVGIDLIRTLALSQSLFATYAGTPLPIPVEHIARHAMKTAMLARAFIPDTAGADLAFSCGLLHDVGRIVLELAMPDQYGRMCADLNLTGETLCAAERRVFGADHARVGSCLLDLWDLPQPLIETIRHHHEPGGGSELTADIVAVVHVAEALSEDRDLTTIDEAFLKNSRFEHELPRWKQIASACAAA